MSEKELMEMVAAEEKRLGVGSEDFMRHHNELMAEMEQIQQREQARKEARRMSRQVYGAKELGELLGVSESKGYELIRTMNKELQEQGYLTVRGKISAAYVKKRFFGVEVDANAG